MAGRRRATAQWKVERTAPWIALLLAASCRAADEVRFLSAEPPPFAPGTHFATRALFASPDASFHVTRVAESLAPHYHAHSAETVYVIAGSARMQVGGETFELARGSVVHVPRGSVHSVEVLEEATVLSVFTPPFDASDRIFSEP